MDKTKHHFAIRTSRELLNKLSHIAQYNGRSANKEIELLIKKHIAEFEKEHGDINFEEKL